MEMLDKEDLQAIAQLMDTKLAPINARLDKVDARLDKVDARLDAMEDTIAELKEDAAVTRSGVNTLLSWAEKAQVQVKIPLFQKAE